MNKTESLDILNKYIDALKDKADTEASIGKIGTENREIVRDAAIDEFPFGKLVAPFLVIFGVPGVIICIFIRSDLSYKNQLPVIAAIIAGCVVAALVAAKIAHVLINRKRSRNNKALVNAVNTLGESREIQYQNRIDTDNRKIAEAESAIPLACRGSMDAKQARKRIMSGEAENLVEAVGAYTAEDWEWAYQAKPKFYGNSEEVPFGALPLSEATRTVLPKDPQKHFLLDGKPVTKWKMAFVSLTDDGIVGDGEYFETLPKIERYILDSNEDFILVRGLTLKEIERLKK